uniref:AlNc14C511G11989 protein n=1 Tax=Albugo laibachii Nc14 TaxID=890382 RepID=F0X0P2_9STRA|nr:AlNc14C511G11989 [Albugo laibachii Nc14]|eukprot:CCA27336.1 AlNc14C511G11989 [Albugo laibachii Nc14]
MLSPTKMMGGEEYVSRVDNNGIHLRVKKNLQDAEFPMFEKPYCGMPIHEIWCGGRENSMMKCVPIKNGTPTFQFLNKVDAWVNGDNIEANEWATKYNILSKKAGSCDI